MTTRILHFLACLRSDNRGVTALEYGVIAAGTVVAISATMTAIGPILKGVFTSIQAAL